MSMLLGGENVPNTVIIGVILIVVEATSASEAAEAAFEVVDQASRCVGVFARGANARAEVDIMIDWRGAFCRAVCEV